MLRPALLLLTLLEGLVLALNGIPVGQKYEVVFPRKLHAQHKRDTQGRHPDLVQYGLELNGKPLVLHLERTDDLISEDYTETHYLEDGTPVTSSPQEQDHCYYQGRVQNDSSSQVSLSTCHGLSGMIMTQEQKLLIEPLNPSDSGAHVLYEYQAQEAPKTCGVDNTTFNETIMTKTSFSSSSAEKHKFLRSKKYIQLYMVADNSMFIKYNRNKEAVKRRIFEIVNFINQVYKQINTFVALTGMEIWDTRNQFEVVTSANTDLNQFSTWRKEKLLPRKHNDNAQFLTDTDFDGSTVGLAWVGTFCDAYYSTGVNQDHTKESIPIGATMAHEMGHNLGMKHDESNCRCGARSCIMEPSLSHETPQLFSQCSHQNFNDFILDHMPLCMKDMPDKNDIVATAVCGNGFTEIGEQCDCGTVTECKNKCCNATTCKLTEDAQCAEGDCCANCQMKSAGSVCREAKDECDLSEMCDGKSSSCPSDRFIFNGSPCRDGAGYCLNGTCPTLQRQCEVHWGAGHGAADDNCFRVNTYQRNCLQSGSKTYCAPKDVKCGVLFCKRGYSSTCLMHSGVVETGTACASGSVCENGQCITIEEAYRSTNCSAKCPGHGVCDHELKCQCQEGWAPPRCDIQTKSSYGYIIVIVIIVLIIIIVVFLLYKRVQRRKQRSSGAGPGVTNPTFNIQNQTRQPQLPYSSSPQIPYGRPLYTQQAPVQPQMHHIQMNYAAYPPPPPPSQAQKPYVPSNNYGGYPPQPQQGLHAFQKPSTAPPPRPSYPPVPSQAMKPNMRR